MYNRLDYRLYEHFAVRAVTDEMRRKLRLRVGYGKTTSARLARIRPTNTMEGESVAATIPIGANEHELIRLGNIR